MDKRLRELDREGYTLEWYMAHVRMGMLADLSEEEFNAVQQIYWKANSARYLKKTEPQRTKLEAQLDAFFLEQGNEWKSRVGPYDESSDERRLLVKPARAKLIHTVRMDTAYTVPRNYVPSVACASRRGFKSKISRSPLLAKGVVYMAWGGWDNPTCTECPRDHDSETIWVRPLTPEDQQVK